MKLNSVSSRKIRNLIDNAYLIGGSIQFEGDHIIPLQEARLEPLLISKDSTNEKAKAFVEANDNLVFITKDYYNGEYDLTSSQLFIPHMEALAEADMGGYEAESNEMVTPPYLYFVGNIIINKALSTQQTVTIAGKAKLTLIKLYNETGDTISLAFRVPTSAEDTNQWIMDLMGSTLNKGDIRKLAPFFTSHALNYVNGFKVSIAQPQSGEEIYSSKSIQNLISMQDNPDGLIIITESTNFNIKWTAIKTAHFELADETSGNFNLIITLKNNAKISISLMQDI